MKAFKYLQCLAAYHVSDFQKTESLPKQKTLARNLVSGRVNHQTGVYETI